MYSKTDLTNCKCLSDRNGPNCNCLITSLLSSISAYPSVSREARDTDGKLTLLSGLDRLEIIRDCKIFNIATNEMTKIDKLGKIYSAKWHAGKKNNYKD